MADKIDKINKEKSEEEVNQSYERNMRLIETYFIHKGRTDKFEILKTTIELVYEKEKSKYKGRKNGITYNGKAR